MLQKMKRKNERFLQKEAIFIGKFDFYTGSFPMENEILA
jgi:hypothetical protein